MVEGRREGGRWRQVAEDLQLFMLKGTGAGAAWPREWGGGGRHREGPGGLLT